MGPNPLEGLLLKEVILDRINLHISADSGDYGTVTLAGSLILCVPAERGDNATETSCRINCMFLELILEQDVCRIMCRCLLTQRIMGQKRAAGLTACSC